MISKVLSEMWLWHATDAKGSLTPYDLEHMQVTGITPEVVKRAKAMYKPRPEEAD